MPSVHIPRFSHIPASVLEQSAEELLKNARQVEAVGPRPSKSRALYRMLTLGLGVTLGVMVASASIAPLLTSWIDGAQSRLVPGWTNAVSTPVAKPSTPVVLQSEEMSAWWTASQVMGDQAPSAQDFVALAKDQGLTPRQAYTVLLHMARADRTVVLGRDIDILKIQESERIEASAQWLRLAWEDSDSLSQLVEGDVLLQNELTEQPYLWSYHQDDKEQWERVRGEWARQQSAATQLNLPHRFSPDIDPHMDVEQANAELIYAVQEVGLAALYVPAQVQSDPILLQEMTQRLRQANQELERITGWGGAVLGLNHRIVLDLGNADQSGHAVSDRFGFIRLTASWDNLAHEWLHALDFAQTQQIDKSMSSPLSSYINLDGPLPATMKNLAPVRAQHAVWQALQNPDLTESDRLAIAREAQKRKSAFEPLSTAPNRMFQALYEIDQTAPSTVPAQGSPWLHWRRSAIELMEEKSQFLINDPGMDYLGSPTEILAFSFHAHTSAALSHQNEGSVLRDPLLWSGLSSVSYEPSMRESLAQQKNWTAYFKTLAPWWHNDQAQRLMINPSDRIEVSLASVKK